MDDQKAEQVAALLLRRHGFTAELIEETVNPTPDIRAADDEGISYLIEIKQRTVAWLDKAEPSELVGDVLRRKDPGGPSNTLAGVIEKAVKQLDAEAKGQDVLRLIWFIVESSDRNYHYNQIGDTVYGTRIVITKSGSAREGVYVAPAAFVRWRNSLDGVLLGTAGLLLNDLSPRYARLKQSKLTRLFGGGVFDPVEIKNSGQFYYLTPDDLPPTQENIVSRLEATYGIQVFKLINLDRISAAVASPDAPVP